jgi:uncharacterized protein YbjT (DUF2867 family)
MRVLLTGATGCIGRRLKGKLLDAEGVELRLFVCNAAKSRPRVVRSTLTY